MTRRHQLARTSDEGQISNDYHARDRVPLRDSPGFNKHSLHSANVAGSTYQGDGADTVFHTTPLQYRSRSSTMPSGMSHISSSASCASNDPVSRPRSQYGRSPSRTSMFERPETIAKSLLSKGTRALRRQRSKFSLGSTPSLDSLYEATESHLEVQELSQRARPQSRKSTAHPSMFVWNHRPTERD